MKLILIGNPNIIHIRRYVQDLADRGHEIYLVGEHKPTREPPGGCQFYDLTGRVNVRKLRYLFWPVEIRKLVRVIKPEIVHAIGVASAGWLAAMSGFRPFIVSALGSDLMLLHQRNLIHQFLSKYTIRTAGRLLCVSGPLYNRALELGAKANKTQILYLGINTRIFKPGERIAARNMLALPGNPLVLSIRAMSPVYRPLDLAQAIPIVVATHPEVRFLIFLYNTDQHTYKAFQRAIQDAGVEDSVIMVNEIQNEQEIASYYQSANMAISIPSSDGTPSSVLEAMACGLPVIATDLPTLHEWIVPRQNGYLIKVGDINGLAKAILEILDHPALGEEMGKRASQEGFHRWDRDKCLDELETVYKSIGRR